MKLGKFEVKYAEYDRWIGLFIDRKKMVKYLCIVPMIVIVWSFAKKDI